MDINYIWFLAGGSSIILAIFLKKWIVLIILMVLLVLIGMYIGFVPDFGVLEFVSELPLDKLSGFLAFD